MAKVKNELTIEVIKEIKTKKAFHLVQSGKGDICLVDEAGINIVGLTATPHGIKLIRYEYVEGEEYALDKMGRVEEEKE